MRFPPSRAIYVDDLGVDVAFSVSSGAARAAPDLARGDIQAPPTPKAVGDNVVLLCWKVTEWMT